MTSWRRCNPLNDNLSEIKKAIIKLNHFSEEMLEWKGEVSTNQKWIIRIVFLILVAVVGQYFV